MTADEPVVGVVMVVLQGRHCWSGGGDDGGGGGQGRTAIGSFRRRRGRFWYMGPKARRRIGHHREGYCRRLLRIRGRGWGWGGLRWEEG